MPLQSSGAISLTDIQTEFGGANPISINEYYQNGGIVGSVFGIPSSGQIAFSDFYGKSNFIMPDQAIIALGYDGSTPYNSVTGSYSTISTTNIITNQGVVGSDTNTTNNNITGRTAASGSGYGGDKGILLYGFPSPNQIIAANKRNLVNNLGVVADDSTTSGSARGSQKQAEYGGDKAIVIGGFNDVSGTTVYMYTKYNLINNTGVVATDSTTGSGFLSEYGALVRVGVRYGGDKAYFHKFLSSSNSGTTLTSVTVLSWIHNVNLVSNTGVIANDVTQAMPLRNSGGSSGYGNDKAIVAYGNNPSTGGGAGTEWNTSTLISNTGTVAGNSNSLGTGRSSTTGTTYGRDKAIFAYGNKSGSQPTIDGYKFTYVNNLGVLTNETTGVGKYRQEAAGAGIG